MFAFLSLGLFYCKLINECLRSSFKDRDQKGEIVWRKDFDIDVRFTGVFVKLPSGPFYAYSIYKWANLSFPHKRICFFWVHWLMNLPLTIKVTEDVHDTWGKMESCRSGCTLLLGILVLFKWVKETFINIYLDLWRIAWHDPEPLSRLLVFSGSEMVLLECRITTNFYYFIH